MNDSTLSDPRPAAPCSVVVLTLNEERNIGACLDSISAFADVHVVDAGSIDGTQRIAAARGAHCVTNAFRSFAEQRNWAHDHAPLRHDWVLHLDADERMTAELAAELARVISADDSRLAGFMIAEKTLLRGRWLKHAGQYPRYQARLVHRRRMRFVDHGHGQRESSSLPFGTLAEPYIHLAFSHGIERWLHKHAGYAILEAQQMLVGNTEVAFRDLIGLDAVRRRRALKTLSRSLPLRPLLRFLHVLLISRGILDGSAGFEYARMMSVFQAMIDLALAEAKERGAERTVATRDPPLTSEARNER